MSFSGHQEHNFMDLGTAKAEGHHSMVTDTKQMSQWVNAHDLTAASHGPVDWSRDLSNLVKEHVPWSEQLLRLALECVWGNACVVMVIDDRDRLQMHVHKIYGRRPCGDEWEICP